MKKARIMTVIVCVMAISNIVSAENIRGINIDFVTIGNAGNATDSATGSLYGAVSYNYRIGKYEVTNAQWNAFTTVAGVPTGYSEFGPNYDPYNQITYYSDAQQPTNMVSWYEAAQFCNYLTSGDKSKGVYRFSGNNTNPGWLDEINRNAAISSYGVAYFIPTQDEWYKAAYFKPDGSGYSLYSNGTNTIPSTSYACYSIYTQPWCVGSGTQEQNGTFDMMGNVMEWNETPNPNGGTGRGVRGGDYNSNGLSSSSLQYYYSYTEYNRIGFRVASNIPEPDIAPIANAGSDQNVMDADDNGSEVVTLDGSGSSDSDGTITSWVWTDDLGDTIPDGEITTATLSVGTHTITLTVTDDDGLTDTNTVTVTIEPYPNQPPVAHADGPYTIYIGETLTLDASGSTDDDNNIVSYLWDLDDNNSFETDAGSNAVFDVNYAYLQSLNLLVGNTYKIHLKVTDGEGQSDVNDSTLTIIPTPALQVIVDIKPGSCPNPLNVKSSGVLPAAILGTADFDVTTIDATSIRLAGVSPLRNSIEDVARPAIDSNDCNCTEDGPDGLADLSLKFKTQDIVEAIGDVNYGDTVTLKLTGVLIGENPIEGADCVVIGGKSKPFNKADVNKDGVVDSLDFAIFAESWLQSSIAED